MQQSLECVLRYLVQAANYKENYMATNFNALLSDDQKRAILEQNIQQLAYQGYQHELNMKTAESLGSEEGVTSAHEYLSQVEAALSVHQEQLSLLPETAEVAE